MRLQPESSQLLVGLVDCTDCLRSRPTYPKSDTPEQTLKRSLRPTSVLSENSSTASMKLCFKELAGRFHTDSWSRGSVESWMHHQPRSRETAQKAATMANRRKCGLHAESANSSLVNRSSRIYLQADFHTAGVALSVFDVTNNKESAQGPSRCTCSRFLRPITLSDDVGCTLRFIVWANTKTSQMKYFHAVYICPVAPFPNRIDRYLYTNVFTYESSDLPVPPFSELGAFIAVIDAEAIRTSRVAARVYGRKAKR